MRFLKPSLLLVASAASFVGCTAAGATPTATPIATQAIEAPTPLATATTSLESMKPTRIPTATPTPRPTPTPYRFGGLSFFYDKSLAALNYPASYLGQAYEEFFRQRAASTSFQVDAPLRLFGLQANELNGEPESIIVMDKRYLLAALTTGDADESLVDSRLLLGVSMPSGTGHTHPSIIIPDSSLVVCARTAVARDLADVQAAEQVLKVGVAKGDSAAAMKWLAETSLPMEIVEFDSAPMSSFNQGLIDLIAPCGPHRNNPHWFNTTNPYATPLLYFGARPDWLATDSARWPSVTNADDFISTAADAELADAYRVWATVPSSLAIFIGSPGVDRRVLDGLRVILEGAANQTCLAPAVKEHEISCPLKITTSDEIGKFVTEASMPSILETLTDVMTPFYSEVQILSAVGRTVNVLPSSNPDLVVPGTMTRQVTHIRDGCWLVQYQWEYAFGDGLRVDTIWVDERAPGAPAVVSIESSHEDTAASGASDPRYIRCL